MESDMRGYTNLFVILEKITDEDLSQITSKVEETYNDQLNSLDAAFNRDASDDIKILEMEMLDTVWQDYVNKTYEVLQENIHR